MVGTAAVSAPSWASVPAVSAMDLMWLAYGDWAASRAPREGGIAAAVAWAAGLRPGPVTGRAGLAVTLALADAECVAAQLVVDAAAGLPRFPAELYCADRGVEFVPAGEVSVEWAAGAWGTLRWLLGRSTATGPAPPPMAIPIRRDNGTLVSAAELYASRLAALALAPIPEQRRAIRLRAATDAARSARLAERIRSIRREAASGT